MATINPTITQLEPQDGSIVKFVWVLTGTNDGAPVPFVQWADRSVQIGSTGDVFGGGTVLWEGSNDSGLTYGTLTDAQSAPISKTAITSPEQIVEITQLARPRASVSVTSVTISLVVRRQQPLRT
jgi:hypothetical protein